MLDEYIKLYREKEAHYEKWCAATDNLYAHEEKILKEFGLPNEFRYSYYLSKLINSPNPDSVVQEVMVDLYKLGVEYANREPKHNLQILRDAKREFSEAHEILPSIGVVETSYAEFIYNEIFLTGREDEKTTLTFLKDANTYEELENLLYFHQRIRGINKKLNIKEIPYLIEFLKQDPENEELVEQFNPQHEITEEDENVSDYRKQLIKTRILLEDFGQQLFTCLINVAMTGELASTDEFEVGDVLKFNESDFRYLDDQNVQLIIKVLDAAGRSCATMININNLDSTSEGEDTPF